MRSGLCDLTDQTHYLSFGPQAQHFLDDFLMEQVDSTAKLRVLRSRLSLDSSAVLILDKELR